MSNDSTLHVRTKNWKISAKDSLSAQFGLGIGTKIFICSNDIRPKPMYFAWLSGSAGLKAGADLSIINTLLKKAVGMTTGYTRQEGNPLSKDFLDKLEVTRPFSFQDLAGSTAGEFSAGVASAAAVGMSYMVGVSGIGQIFTLSKSTVEVKPSVELNAMNGTIGWLIPADVSYYEGTVTNYERQKMDRLVSTPPRYRFDMDAAK